MALVISILVKFPTHPSILFFFFNDTATTEIYTLSLHDALPILLVFGQPSAHDRQGTPGMNDASCMFDDTSLTYMTRSEEHTSELQSRLHLVCRLLLEKKKTTTCQPPSSTTCTSTAPRWSGSWDN